MYWPPCMPSFPPPKTIARVTFAGVGGLGHLRDHRDHGVVEQAPAHRVLRIDLQSELVDDVRRLLEVPAVDVDHRVPDVGALRGTRAVEERGVARPGGESGWCIQMVLGRVRIDALERDVVGAGRPLERGHANEVAGERGRGGSAACALPTASCVASSDVLAFERRCSRRAATSPSLPVSAASGIGGRRARAFAPPPAICSLSWASSLRTAAAWPSIFSRSLAGPSVFRRSSSRSE